MILASSQSGQVNPDFSIGDGSSVTADGLMSKMLLRTTADIFFKRTPMGTFQIRKGLDIKLKGQAAKEIKTLPLSKTIAVAPCDYKGLKLRLSIKEGDAVKVGSQIFQDKFHPEIRILSPVSGRVAMIIRGEKRALLRVIIETDGKQEQESFKKFNEHEILGLSQKDVTTYLLEGGLWPVIRQRPFSKIANHRNHPKAVFIHAMNTEPLALDVDVLLDKKEKEFQLGLDILKHLTKGEVHLCIHARASAKALTEAKRVQIQRFSGPHPAGNVSTHIQYVDPINKGDVVWYVEAQDVLRVASLFMNGAYASERVVAITGEGAKNRYYARTCLGAPLSALVEDGGVNGLRYISGSVLTGKDVGKEGFLGFYDSQVTVIPEGGKREFLGWLSAGFNKFTVSKTFASAFLPEREVSLNTDKNGSDRAIVLNNIFDKYVALDIMTFFLLRAVISGDIEEAEKLGILECDEEDFALCTFACPSKTDVGEIMRSGLDLIEKEG